MDENDKFPEDWSLLEKLRHIQSGDVLFKIIMKRKENVKAFVEIAYPKLAKHLDFDTIRIVDTEKYNTLGSKKRYLDVAFEVGINGSEKRVDLYFILEHKSKPDRGVYLQLLSYIHARYEEVYRQNKEFPNIIPMVVYVGKEDWNLPTSTIQNLSVSDEIKANLFRISFLLYTPKSMTMEQVESIRKDLELYSYALLMKTIIEEIPLDIGLEKILLYIQDKEVKSLFLLEVQRLSGIDFKDFRNILSKLPSGGEDVKNLFEEAIEYGKMEGIIEGEKKGKMEGIIEGEKKGEVKAILDILEIRFGAEDLEDIREALKSINDIEFLDYLRVQAKKVPSMDEFKRLMDRM